MLDQEAIQIVTLRLNAEAFGREHSFAREIGRACSEAAIKGQGNSGALLQMVADVCAAEVEARAKRIWEIVQPLVAGNLAIASRKDIDLLKRQLDDFLLTYCFVEPANEFERVREQVGAPASAAEETKYYSRKMGARMLIWAEIDQLAREMRNRASVESLRHETPRLTSSTTPMGAPRRIFIGHGHSPVWKDVRDFLVNRLRLEYEEFNREPSAGKSNKERLQEMLDISAFALIVMTGEDEAKDGKLRARENVVHEAGLFQGKLGFERAIILLEEGCEEFSNIEGLIQVHFPRGNIMAVSEDIRRTLERESLIPKA